MKKSLASRTVLLVLLILGYGGRGSARADMPEALRAKSSADWLSLTASDASANVLLVKYGGLPPARMEGPALGGAALSHVHATLGAEVAHAYRLIPWVVVKLPSTVSLAEAAAHYAADPAVRFVEPNTRVELLEMRPNDPRYRDLWGMERINAPQAWDITTGNSNIVVGVIDTGVRYTHEDLAGNMWVNPDPGPMNDIHGAVWTGGTGQMTSGDPNDTDGHGTHVAGTIGAIGNNNLGVAGVTWQVRLMALKFLDPFGWTADAISAVEYAIEHGAHLTNNSWGGGPPNLALQEMIEQAAAANQLFVAAAGNDTNDNDVNPAYPASYPVDNIISVASLAPSGALSGFSNFGANSVHIAAPGSGILSAWSTSDSAYNTISGTSMASPHVAGAAALLLGFVPTLHYSELRAAILDGAAPNSALTGRVSTDGELDLPAALNMVGGALTLDRQAYRSDAPVTVTVFDPFIDESEASVPADWAVTNTVAGTLRDSGTITLDRQAGALFEGVFQLETGTIAVNGDTLTVRYTVGNDDVHVRTVPIDDVPPEILNLRFENVTFERFDVLFETDEPARVDARAGRLLPPAEHSVSRGAYATNHVIAIEGLHDLSRYYISVTAEDLAGNETRLPADPDSTDAADYESVFLPRKAVSFRVDFERGAPGWEATSLFGPDCWEYGENHYGPEPPKRLWGTRLNGRYPNGVNAVLVSPRFDTADSPVLTLRHWFEMQRTGDFFLPPRLPRLRQREDCGIVEVLIDGVWQSIMPYTDDSFFGTFTRSSDGWIVSTFRLPETYANRTLQARFRFKSDQYVFGDGNPPGWYIDSFEVSGAGAPGVYITGIEVDDTAGGDGDGFAEPGETVGLTIHIANLTGEDLADVTAEMRVFAEGAVGEWVSLVAGSPAALDFGDVPDDGDAQDGPVGLAISPDANPDARVIVDLLLTDGEGRRYEAREVLSIEPRETLTGMVVDRTNDAPIADVRVVARRGSERIETLTGLDGSFALTGLRSAVTYAVSADKPDAYSRETQRVQTPPDAPLVFRLGAALAELQPDTLAVEVLHGENAEGAFSLTNTGSLPIEFAAVVELPLALEDRPEIVKVLPSAGVVGPGDDTELRVTVRTGDIDTGTYMIRLEVASNDLRGGEHVAEMQLTVLEQPMLAFHGARVDTDGSPWLVSDEDGSVWVRLRNRHAFSPATGTTGTLAVANTNQATIADGAITWPVIGPGMSAESSGVAVTPDPGLAHGEVVWFDLDVTDSAGMDYAFSFALTNYHIGSVTGMVTCTHWSADGLTSDVLPVAEATVIVEDTWGNVVAEVETDADGAYTVDRLRTAWHWFRVETPPRPQPAEPDDDTSDDNGDDDDDDDGDDDPEPSRPTPFYMALEGRAALVGTDAQVNLDMVDYGRHAPFPVLRSVTVRDADGNGYIERGEPVELDIRLVNAAPTAAIELTGVLTAAAMGVDPVMTVTQPSATTPVALNSATAPRLLRPAFAVLAHPNAPKNGLQRYHVTLSGTNTFNMQPISVPLEIRLFADDRIALSGEVRFADGEDTAANMAQTRIRLRLDNGFERALGPVEGEDGIYRYRFDDLPTGVPGDVDVVRVPGGYRLPPPVEVAPIEDDVTVDFTIPSGILASIGANPEDLAFAFQEGRSVTGQVSIVNTGLVAETLRVAIRYRRRHDEGFEPIFGPAAAEAPPEPVDWPSVDPDAVSPDEVVIRFAPVVSRSEMEAFMAAAGFEPVFFFSSFPGALARRIEGAFAPAAFAPEAAAIEDDPRVILVAPDDRAEQMSVPNDPRFDDLYGLLNRRQTGGSFGADIGVTQVWARTTGSHEIVVAVCDTGIMLDHEDLAANIWQNPFPGRGADIENDLHGWNFWNWSPDVQDWHGHGTHVAGTVGAVGDNAIGIAGVNWSVSLMPVRLTSPFGGFTTSARIARAIEYAAENGAHVSNHSWAGPDTARAIHDAIRYAAEHHNHLVIAAAGNSALDLDAKRTYPAGYGGVLDNVITVAAVDHHDELAPFSNFGAKTVHLGAPGVDILSTIPDISIYKLFDIWPWDARYYPLSGTSMAAPHVAGAAALLWSLAPDTDYGVIREAILNGVRPVPHLEGWVKTGGVLDVGRAVEALGVEWLTVDAELITLDPGATEELTLTVNAPPVLSHRVEPYEAELLLSTDDGAGTLSVPVTAAVAPGIWLAVGAVSVERVALLDDGLPPSPGETVNMDVKLRNRGKGTAVGLTGTLIGGGASVIEQADTQWAVLYGGEASGGDVPFRVILDPLATDTLTFVLEVRRQGALIATLPVDIEVLPGRRASGRIEDAAGMPVADAVVECYGASGGRTLSDANGGFMLRGLSDGVHHVRILPAAHARLTVSNAFVLAGADIADIGTFTVAAPRPAFDATIERPILQGVSAEHTLTIVNNGIDGPFAFSMHVAPERRVAVVSDGTSLGELIEPLRDMGLAVSYYTNNFARIQQFWPAYNDHEVQQAVRYTREHAFLANYDAVVVDVGGPDGSGRLLSAAELAAFDAYTARGGRLILAGANPFSRPDNHGLAHLIGVQGLDRADETEAQSQTVTHFESPFAVLAAGDYLRNPVALRHDLAPEVPGSDRARFRTGAAAKLLHRTRERGGALYVWTGSPQGADWAGRGLWRDILRGILWNELLAGAGLEVPWLSLQTAGTRNVQGSVAAGEAADIALLMETRYPVLAEDYRAVAVILGDYDGVDVRAVRIDMHVQPAHLRVLTTGTVRDWGGRPLKGDGGERSALLQVIWTGPDGEVAPPMPDGQPTGQNQLLTVLETGAPHGRFGGGAGVPVDAGRFDRVFRHRLPHGQTNATVFVRAWDAATFDRSLVYGDSPSYTLAFEPGETHDFGSWTLSRALRPERDSNDNSVPDGWLLENMPWLDPRHPIPPLENKGEYAGHMDVTAARVAADPRRVVVTTNLLFVLDTANHRVVVYNRETGAMTHIAGKAGGDPDISEFGGLPGTGPGEFTLPQGMALDPRPGVNRLIVADTGNDRIQVLTFDPLTGDISPLTAFGQLGAEPGQLKKPRGVAVMDGNGDIFVADTENNRVSVFTAAGAHRWSFGGQIQFEMKGPRGIAVDLEDGVFVADTDRNRILQFTPLGIGLNRITGIDGNAFQQPTDVAIWRHRHVDAETGAVLREVRRLVVADRLNNRIQLRASDGTHLLNIGVPGGTQVGELRLPYGVFPLADSNRLYVADTDNRRIQVFTVTLDVDRDGMDDFWEDMHGLDSTRNDAFEDPDGDGLLNIGEFLLGTDPLAPDNPFADMVIGEDGPFRILGIAPLPEGTAGFEPQATGRPFVLMWQSVSGRRYRIERATDMSNRPVAWQSMGEVTASGSVSTFAVSVDADSVFLRVVED